MIGGNLRGLKTGQDANTAFIPSGMRVKTETDGEARKATTVQTMTTGRTPSNINEAKEEDGTVQGGTR